MNAKRILIVDGSLSIRTYLRSAFEHCPSLEVIAAAADSSQAQEILQQSPPDLLLINQALADDSGRSAIESLRTSAPELPAVLYGPEADLSAVDPSQDSSLRVIVLPAPRERREARSRFAAELTSLAQDLLGCKALPPSPPSLAPSPALPGLKPGRRGPFDVLVIGSSTGGPNALAEVVSELGEDFPLPVVVAQHIPEDFAASLARRLDQCSPLTFAVAVDGEPLRPGRGYLAPGNQHLVVRRIGTKVTLHHDDGPPEHSCRPAVDPLFRSTATALGSGVLGLVLTGMGFDGSAGCQSIRAAGGRVLIQDEPSSVVWGMPGAVAAAGACDEILPLSDIPQAIQRILLGALQR